MSYDICLYLTANKWPLGISPLRSVCYCCLIYLSVYPSLHPSVHGPTYLSTIHLSIFSLFLLYNKL